MRVIFVKPLPLDNFEIANARFNKRNPIGSVFEAEIAYKFQNKTKVFNIFERDGHVFHVLAKETECFRVLEE